jgi:maltose alpha-D-glucosyltransferase/alpha-amylase
MRALFFLPFFLFAQDSLLVQAESIAKKFSVEVSKAAPPTSTLQTVECLNNASVFFTLDLEQIESPAFTTLNSEELWNTLREIGVEAVHLKNLKKGGATRTSMSLNPAWGEWNPLAITLGKKGVNLIGDSIGNATGWTADFSLALKNVGDYPSLYHLVEIEKRDWKMLPPGAANIPWLTLQDLHKKGYVPEQFAPYVKASSWNATKPIQCEDGKVRRWIYLKENEADPVIDWLNPTFAGCRIASADLLDSIYNLRQKLTFLNPSIAESAKQTLTLWIRKLSSFSCQECYGLEEMKKSTADLITDTLTRPALLHALLAEDAEALRLMYRLFLEEKIDTKRLVHALQPFDSFTCDWAELAANPWKKFKYYEEILTGEALRTRLLKEDLLRLSGEKPLTWPAACSIVKHKEDLGELHLLLALFYAMQPGAFSFSLSDLLGALEPQTLNPMKTNSNTLYASLPSQMQNQKSFAQNLRKILTIRREQQIAFGELIDVPNTIFPGLLVLVHKVKDQLQLTAINFSRSPLSQTLDLPAARYTTAIDLMTGLAEPKPLEASTLQLKLPPLSGKILLFQTKYYD